MVGSRFRQCGSRAIFHGSATSSPEYLNSRSANKISRRGKNIALQLFTAAAVGFFVLQYVTIEEEETVENNGALSKTQSEHSNTGNNGASEDGKVTEDDIQVPEIMPEDAIFIPLGLARQLPDVPYKFSDPEFQSFVELRKNREKSMAVRRAFASSPYWHRKTNGTSVKLAELVCFYFGSLDSMQSQLGTPISVGKVWLDILFPSRPPPEYERSGYARTFARKALDEL